MPSESELARALDVSRTTVRAVLAALETSGIIGRREGIRCLARAPAEADHVPDAQTVPAGVAAERRLMGWILQGNLAPGQMLNTAELARRLGTSTTTLRECLAQFLRYGLVERRPNSSWRFNGITVEFVTEIYDVREMFELRATRSLLALDDTSPVWQQLTILEGEHHALMADIDRDYSLFPQLDERLHRLVHQAASNRFILDFYDVVSMLFHYTYRWNRADARQRSATALAEHIEYIDALRSRDQRRVDATCRLHLRTARATLARSIETHARGDGAPLSRAIGHEVGMGRSRAIKPRGGVW